MSCLVDDNKSSRKKKNMNSREDEILIKNTVNKIAGGKASKFLNRREIGIIIPFLNKEHLSYNIYYPYEDADKGIIYVDKIPDIAVLSIITKKSIEHKDILGSIFGLSLDIHNFGDIIIDGNNYYIILLKEISCYVETNLFTIGRYKVELTEIPFSVIAEYKREYEELFVRCSSARLDVVIARLLNLSRSKTEKFIKDKLVVLNNMICVNDSYNLKMSDTFSIKGYGKYQFLGIEKTTKNGGLILLINKYK